MPKMTWLPCLILISTSACATISPEANFCTLAHPIYFDAGDKVSVRTKSAVYSHWLTGHRECGWEKAQ